MPIAIFRRGDSDAPNKLAIATCTKGLIRVERDAIFMTTGMPLGQAQGFVFAVDYGIQDARNISYAAAESEGYEYVMFWDDDVVPHAVGYSEMMLGAMEQNPEIDILGGVYPARQGAAVPIVAMEKDGASWWGWEDGGIHKVWMTGTGFTMYRTGRMKRLNPPVKTLNTAKGPLLCKEYFRLDADTDDYTLAIDAESAGLSWYVHGTAVCDQIEPTGKRFEIKDARQRITKEVQDEGEAAEGNNGAARPRQGRRPADVRAG